MGRSAFESVRLEGRSPWRVPARARCAAFNIPLEWGSDYAVTPDCEWTDASRDVGHLLGNLPDRYRLPILHTKLQGLSVTETAVLTGLTESAVKVGVHRGMRRLTSSVSAATRSPLRSKVRRSDVESPRAWSESVRESFVVAARGHPRATPRARRRDMSSHAGV